MPMAAKNTRRMAPLRLLLVLAAAAMATGSNKTFCNPVNLAYRMHVRQPLPCRHWLCLCLPLLMPRPPPCTAALAGQVPRRRRLHPGAVERHVLALHHGHAGGVLVLERPRLVDARHRPVAACQPDRA